MLRQVCMIVVLLLLVGCGAPAATTVSAPAPPTSLPTVAPPTQIPLPPTSALSASRTPVPIIVPNAPTQMAPPITSPTPIPTALPEVKQALRFDGMRAYQHALDQCGIGPRPPGTPALEKTRVYLENHLKQHGWTVERQPFEYGGVQHANIIAKKGQGPLTLIGAHFDTRPIAEKDPDPARRRTPIIGGNDGASGVGVLLELARVWAKEAPPGETWLVFFDAEDSGDINGWPWAIGSAYMAERLTVPVKQMLLVDMIGDTDQQIYLETTSTQPLLNRVFDVAHELGYQRWFIRQPRWAIIDDHTAFLRRGIPAIDLIDFDYPYHHTVADDCTKIAPASLERVGKTLELFMKRGG